MIEHILSLSMIDIDRLLLGMQDISVGPLRLRSIGTCSEEELPRFLDEVFGRSGYSVLPFPNLLD